MFKTARAIDLSRTQLAGQLIPSNDCFGFCTTRRGAHADELAQTLFESGVETIALCLLLSKHVLSNIDELTHLHRKIRIGLNIPIRLIFERAHAATSDVTKSLHWSQIV